MAPRGVGAYFQEAVNYYKLAISFLLRLSRPLGILVPINYYLKKVLFSFFACRDLWIFWYQLLLKSAISQSAFVQI